MERTCALKGRGFGAALLLCAALATASPARAEIEEPMTDAEMASVGCVIAAASVGLATITAGGVALAATGVGAASTAVAVPVVVATMAGGCTFGSMAAPAFVWAKRHGHTITSSLTAALWPR